MGARGMSRGTETTAALVTPAGADAPVGPLPDPRPASGGAVGADDIRPSLAVAAAQPQRGCHGEPVTDVTGVATAHCRGVAESSLRLVPLGAIRTPSSSGSSPSKGTKGGRTKGGDGGRQAAARSASASASQP